MDEIKIIIITILIYLLSVYFFYIIVFNKLFFPFKQKVLVVFLNNCELRWGGGFITHQIELFLILWIPYKLRKINFLDINKYSEESFEPFKSNLSKKISFRDSNFSIFNEENYIRLLYFYKKSFPNNKIPNNLLLFNYTYIEDIFPNFRFSFNGFKINKNNLFRTINHLVSDNDN